MSIEKRIGHRWRADEDAALATLVKSGASQEEIAQVLGRTAAGIRNRLCALKMGSIPVPKPVPTSVPTPVVTLVAAPVMPVTAVPTEPETDLSLLLWFVKEAWREGHTILIPSVGATFQRHGVIEAD